MLGSTAELLDKPSVEEWVLTVLTKRGAQTLDELGRSLSKTNWAQLFLAIDRLSRSGEISLVRRSLDYVISVKDAMKT